ncbi:MAG TPA: hypothetical protein PLX23_04055 [Candidatus Hydrogenedens sp.]|nr:hypothetical protein [Candidatus Hydrogenedens sp.]
MTSRLKKGCLISILIFLLVFIFITTVIIWQMSKSYGLSRAPYMPIPEKIPPNASCQMVLRIPPALPVIDRLIPWEQLKEKTPIPAPHTTIPMALPYELGFWATTEFAKSRVSFTIAVNEKRLGPIIHQLLQDEQPWKQIPQIDWDEGGMQFISRGYLSLSGSIKIPDGVEERVLKDWTSEKKPIQKLSPETKHFCEIQLDSTSGDFLVWTACILNAQGVSWEEELKNNQYAGMVYEIIKKMKQLNITIDPSANPDELMLKIALKADPTSQGPLEFFISGMGLPMVQDYLKSQFGITLEGKLSWDSTESALIGDLTLKNYEPFLKSKLSSLLR